MSATTSSVDRRISGYFADPNQWIEPWDFYRELRSVAPFESTVGGWFVSRWDDVMKVLERDRTSRINATEHHESPLADIMPIHLLDMDPPEHTRLRASIRGVFTPKAMQLLRPTIEKISAELLEPFADAGGMDILRDYAYPLTIRVISDMLGAPLDLSDLLIEAANVAIEQRQIGEQVTAPHEAIQNGSYVRGPQLRSRVRELLRDRRRNPKDDVLTALSDLEARGYENEDEAVTMAIFLLLAGHETTSTMATLMIHSLLRERDQLEQVRADLELVPNAVEECLRYDAPTQLPAHRMWLVEDTELSLVTVPAGALVVPMLGAANRDDQVFTEPDRLDVRRTNSNRHVSFLVGTHFCAGAPLARVELQVALIDLLTKLPPFELAVDEVPFRPNAIVRGVHALPVRW